LILNKNKLEILEIRDIIQEIFKIMTDKKPIHEIAKDLGIDSKRVIEACNQIGIYTKGSSKRLDTKEQEKILTFFNNGKNVASEVVDIKISLPNEKEIEKKLPIKTDIEYFTNRLIKKI